MKSSLLHLAVLYSFLLPACRHKLPDGLPQEYMDELIQMAENGAKHCARLLDDSNPDHCHGDHDERAIEGPSSASILMPANPFNGSKAVVQLNVGCYYLEEPGRNSKYCDAPVYGSDPWGISDPKKM